MTQIWTCQPFPANKSLSPYLYSWNWLTSSSYRMSHYLYLKTRVVANKKSHLELLILYFFYAFFTVFAPINHLNAFQFYDFPFYDKKLVAVQHSPQSPEPLVVAFGSARLASCSVLSVARQLVLRVESVIFTVTG